MKRAIIKARPTEMTGAKMMLKFFNMEFLAFKLLDRNLKVIQFENRDNISPKKINFLNKNSAEK